MRIAFLFFTLFAVACCASVPDIPDAAYRAVQIRSATGTGTAWPVMNLPGEKLESQTLLLTARHILMPLEARVYGQTVKIQKYVQHPREDVQLLWIKRHQPMSVIRMAERMPRYGDTLFGVGYPGRGKFITEGRAGSTLGNAALHCAPGFSGGPVLNTKGEAVGVASSIRVYRGHPVWFLSSFVPLTPDIQSWVRSHAYNRRK